jgi:hypothetical protein
VLVILTATVLFPHIDVTLLTQVLFGALTAGLAAGGVYVARGRIFPLSVPAGGRIPRAPQPPRLVREHWTMPQLELLERPAWSRTRKLGMITLRGYLVIAVLMLIVKAVEVGIGH